LCGSDTLERVGVRLGLTEMLPGISFPQNK
jgi:hypothetical protein